MRTTILSLTILFAALLISSGATTPLIDTNGKVINEIKTKTVIALWPEGTEGINPAEEEKTRTGPNRFYNIHNPSLTLFKPQKPNGTSIIIIPGGGYSIVGFNLEGVPATQRFIQEGVTVFILKYRLPTTKNANFKHPVPLMDAQRAIKLVRYHAETFQIDPNRIGIMGFSAGGHLASTAGTWFNTPVKTDGEIGKINCRPDFMMLIYPVITTQAQGISHSCPKALIGKNSEPDLLKKLSNELNVTANTPPTFLAHAKDDRSVPPENSILFHDALKKHGVTTTLKLYETGGHFSGFFNKEAGHDALNWMDDCIKWLDEMKLLDGKNADL